MTLSFISIIQKELQVKNWQVENTLKLLSEGATIPFISRYRKEMTGSLDEIQVERIKDLKTSLTTLQKRKESIIKSIQEQDKLTDELQQKISDSWNEKEVEDLYLPFKTKRQTKADKAIAAGLSPLAKMILAQNNDQVGQSASRYLSEEYATKEETLQGAKEIAAQWISERMGVRNMLRRLFTHEAIITSKVVKGKETEAEKFNDYFNFSESAKRAKSHRLLALQRGHGRRSTKS